MPLQSALLNSFYLPIFNKCESSSKPPCYENSYVPISYKEAPPIKEGFIFVFFRMSFEIQRGVPDLMSESSPHSYPE